MKVRTIAGIVATCMGLLWLVIFGGAFLEYHSYQARQPATGRLERDEFANRFPLICLDAQMRGVDLFSGEKTQIPIGNIFHRDVARQLGFSGILISIGLIALVGP